MSTNFEPFRLENLGKVCVVHVHGECDFANSGMLEGALKSAARDTFGVVIASFVECSFADCSCLGALIRQFKELGTRLMIVAPPKSSFRRILSLTGMGDVLPVFDELSAAYAVAPLRAQECVSFADGQPWDVRPWRVA